MINYCSIVAALAPCLLALLIGLALGTIRLRNLLILNRFFPILEDYFLSIAQMGVLLSGIDSLTYYSAGTDFPQIDRWLQWFDNGFGVDRVWIDRFLMNHTWASMVAIGSYTSWGVQIITLSLLNSCISRRDRNSDLIWLFLICLVLDCLFLAFFPAQSMDSNILYIKQLSALRVGVFRIFDMANSTGLVAFPSFHAAMAVIFIYVARITGRLFPIFVLLNLTMLVSAVPMGGHYLADVIAGVALTLVVIALLARVKSGRPYRMPRVPQPISAPPEPIPVEPG